MHKLNHTLIHYLWATLLVCLFSHLSSAEEATSVATLPDIETGKVSLPWSELKKLLEEIDKLKQAAVQDKEKQKIPIPVEHSITEASLKGEVKEATVRFEANFAVQIFKKGWNTVSFFPKEVGIEAITFNPLATTTDASGSVNDLANSRPSRKSAAEEQKIAQLVRDANGYSLLAQGPQTLTMQVIFHVPLQMEELTYTLSFLPPKAVINRLHLSISEKGVTMLQMPPHSQVTQTEELTTVETVLSERDELKLRWQIDQDSGVSRKSLATYQALASVNKSDLTVVNTVVLKYVDSLTPITFQLPQTVEILNVSSLDIEQWTTEKQESFQIIKLTGPADSRTPVKIDISYRWRLPTLPAEVTIPTLEVTGIDNVEGFLGVEVLENLEVTATKVKEGVLIPAKNLPKPLWQKASNPLLHGYQFYQPTFAPTLNIRSYQEIQTVVANVDWVDGMTHRTLEGKSITRMTYFIRNNDRQFLTLTLPDNSRIWQTFVDGTPVKPAQKDTGEILIPMKKSAAVQGGEDLQSFSIEVGYTTEVSKLSLKGDILNQLPAIDIPISYLRWSLYLPEYYEYSGFEGPLKRVASFSQLALSFKSQLDIPTQGQLFLFEKHLVVDEKPFMRGKYGQFLGDDIFLSLSPSFGGRLEGERFDTQNYPTAAESKLEAKKPQVILNRGK